MRRPIKDAELMLLLLLEATREDSNKQAIVLQSYIQMYGPLTEELATKVRRILSYGGSE